MALSDYESFWSNPFQNTNFSLDNKSTDLLYKEKEFIPSDIYHVSDIHQPCPKKLPFDSSSDWSTSDNDETENHFLEDALRDMVANGELEDFLRSNTINLKEIQDDMQVCYGKSIDHCESQHKPRVRRHSIGTTEDIIRCPFPGCEKIFNRIYNFKSHFKIHTGDRPYKCGYCELNFARCHDLKRHEKIHNKENKLSYKCNFCSKTFSRSDALNRHVKLNICQNFNFY